MAIVKVLIEAGAAVNAATTAGGATPLHRAAYAGHTNIVEVLLHSGASLHLADADGQTALYKATQQGHSEVVELLQQWSIKDARSPGRAGFRRSTYYDPDTSSGNRYRGGDEAWGTGYQGRYTRPGYMHYSQRMAAEMRTFWRIFTSSGSASLTAALGGLFIGGILFLEPLFSSAWERNNEGKLFKSIEEDVAERKRAQLVAFQAARGAREAAAAAVKTTETQRGGGAASDLIIKENKQLPNEPTFSIDIKSALLQSLQHTSSPAAHLTPIERDAPPPRSVAPPTPRPAA
ncbi:putative Ankyrin repeat domain-containing protein 39 [Nannochloris sp. 'desiccata']|nr:hypothetical protein KSW81_004996 [Chlorella desiccata (nom. nud.)]KAH7618013.1 putative Ankyrin repeat domain-containing protein 39 [Chlorella desiccata (nom. nud.)]